MPSPIEIGIDEESLLSEFAGADESRAAFAFSDLERRARPFLAAVFWRAGARRDQIDDLAQETLLVAWKYRDRFRPAGKAAWYSFLKRIASQRLTDSGRRGGLTVQWDENCDVRDPNAEDEISLLEKQSAAELKRAADAVLMGLSPQEPPGVLEARLLAAQLFYLDKAPWQEVLDLLAPAFPRGAAPNRATLDEWLCDPSLLRLLAFRRLCFSGKRLARAVTDDTRLSAPEVRVLEWRLGNGLTWEQIGGRSDCPLSEAELARLGVRLPLLFPFEREMDALLVGVGRAPARVAALKNIGLWQRLAFEYWYVEGLTRADVLERLTPAAEMIDVRLSANAVNMWLSGGRLAQRIAVFLREEAKTRGETPGGDAI